MTETKKPEQQKPEAKATTARKELLPASESSDPAVHALLAELDAAIQNGDGAAADKSRERLAELGYK